MEGGLQFTGVTYTGAGPCDESSLSRLPSPLSGLLLQLNGFIVHRGGLHVRGVCETPAWHSIQHVWSGASALNKLYTTVGAKDVPFAQDCVGDQYLLRDGHVVRLLAETGELEDLRVGLFDFLKRATADPDDTLDLSPLQQFEDTGERLQPGQLLHAYPPFCTAESEQGVSLRAIPALELIEWHADLARQIAGLDEGDAIRIDATD